MKNKYLTIPIKLLIIVYLFCSFSIKVDAQDQFAQFLTNGTQDVNKLVKAYSSPMLKAIGNDFNNGWYTTADPLNLGRFDLRFIGTASFCPKNEQTFNLANLHLNYIKPAQGSSESFPTIFGKENSASQVMIYASTPGTTDTMKVTRTLKIPTSGVNFFPAVTPQLNIGLIKGTELMIRFCPKVKVPVNKDESLYTSLWGIGIKHDIKQWIPGINHLPFSLSAIGAITKANLYMDGPILEPSDYESGENLRNLYPTDDYNAQKVKYNVTSWNIGVAASKKLSVITLFGGLHLSGSKSSLAMDGAYPIINYKQTGYTYEKVIDHVIKPIDLDVTKTQFGINAGFRLKLAIVSLTLSGNYAPGGYSSATFALGLGYFN